MLQVPRRDGHRRCGAWRRSYNGTASDLRSYIIIVLLQVTMAAAFVALAAYFAAPTVWTAISADLLKHLAPWFDVFSAYDQLASDHPWRHIGPTLTSIGVWVVLPSVVGSVRSLRRDVK